MAEAAVSGAARPVVRSERPPSTVYRSVAPAKINLYLHVTGRRIDGYHTLDSLTAFAGVGDTVTAEASSDLSLAVDGPRAAEIPTDSSNLVLKAAERLRQAAGVKAGARLTLTKRLPVAAGIGGGSADAAAALRVLARLWGIDPNDGRLGQVALETGADVPVCLHGKAAFVAGIGEILTPVPSLPAAWLVLANPGVALATPAVFKARQGAFSSPAPFGQPVADAGTLAELLKARRNDLTAAAVSLVPQIGRVLTALETQPGILLARMSGSGATCFGLWAEQPSAEAAARALSESAAGWWVVAAPLLADIAEGKA